MNRLTRTTVLSASLLLAAFAPHSFADDKAAPATQPAAGADAKKDRPEVEVCFVLDTTGSMGGLIEGAKQKIWSIANTIIAVPDKPRIKVALIGFRDKNDAYVTKVFDLTDDIDTVFKNLQAFQADGGGDTPESVNQALNEAVTKIAWTDRKEVTKLLFLVGDAPPHMDYADDVKYPETCALAAKRGIILHAVQCGNIAETAPVWKEIAKLGHGSYIPLAQEGGMAAIPTPFDKDLAELNAKVARTAVAYGSRMQQTEVAGKIAANSSGHAGASLTVAEASRFADRAAYNSKDAAKAVQGGGDLVWACANGVVRLADVKADELPPELQKMSPDERKAYVDGKQKERDGYQAKIADLSKQREAFIAAEQAKLAKAKPADAFDAKVSAAVREAVEAKK